MVYAGAVVLPQHHANTHAERLQVCLVVLVHHFEEVGLGERLLAFVRVELALVVLLDAIPANTSQFHSGRGKACYKEADAGALT